MRWLSMTVPRSALLVSRSGDSAVESLNIVTERLTGESFDVVIATNILVYLQPLELTLALANISSLLRPGGVLLHNEVRTGFDADAAPAGLALEQSRQVVIATVMGAAPLADTIFLYRRRAR